MNKNPCVIFDLDGTLCELVYTKTPYNHNGTEVLIQEMYEELVKEWYPLNLDIIILTGRGETHREITEKWLDDNGIDYDYLLMNPAFGQALENHRYKRIVLNSLKQFYDIRMMYDDNPQVERVCRQLKIPFYHCY